MSGGFPGIAFQRATLVLAMALLGPSQANADQDRSFLVACMRVQPKRWDKAHNLALLEHYAKEAAGQGAELVVTCEGFLDGYCSNANHVPGLAKERLLNEAESGIDNQAKRKNYRPRSGRRRRTGLCPRYLG